MQKLLRFILKNKIETSLVSLVIIVASFLRLYRISDYMTFLGDEGRDVIIARDILLGNLTLLGPRASAGDFFLGPIYYYMMAPFLWLSNFDPVGPAVMVALIGVATVFLVYFVGKTFFDTKAGIMAAGLYAVSPLVIAYSRSSWNPNPMPFFSLLSLFILYFALKKNSLKLFLLVGFLLGIAIQLHYLTVFLGVIVFFFVLIGDILIKQKQLLVNYSRQYLSLFFGFIVGWLPFLVFEARHGFPNIRTIFNFIFIGSATNDYPLRESFASHITDTFLRLFGRLITLFPPQDQIDTGKLANLDLWILGTLILAFASIAALFIVRDKLKVLLFSFWLLFGVVLFGFYKKSIYDYYFGFMFPLPFLLVGNLLSTIWNRFKKWGMVVSIIIFIGLVALNLSGNPFRSEPNRQKEQAQHIAEFVLSKTDNKPFNFALLTGGNSDHLYRYFMEIKNKPPITILNSDVDPQRTSVTDQLLIVCEQSDCQPLGNSLWEVAGFGRAEIAGEWDLVVVKVYKLVRYEGK